MIKYNVKTVNDWLYNSNPIKKLYYNGTMRYRRFVANGSPTPPTPPSFDGKFKAEYSGGQQVYSAACDGDTTLGVSTTKPGGHDYTAMTSAEIGNCVTSIGKGAFSGCRSLTSCTIGSGVTSIANNAFNNCRSLSNVTIPSGVTSIGSSAFQSCSGLTSVTIPSGVTSIGQQAFSRCSGLTSVTVEAVTPPTLGSYVFHYTSSNLVINVPSASLTAYQTADGWSVYADRIQSIS